MTVTRFQGWTVLAALLASSCGNNSPAGQVATGGAGSNDASGGESSGDGGQGPASGGAAGAGSGGTGGATGGAAGATGGTAGTPGSGGTLAGSGGTPAHTGGVGAMNAGGAGAGGKFEGPLGATNVWTNVTPARVDLSTLGACGNYGAESVQADPARPGDVYTMFMCQGVWKSRDYGLTWDGPINTGQNGAMVTDCAGAIKAASNKTTSPPTLFASCIRGSGSGFWRSTNGGVDWTRYIVSPAGANQQFYPPAVDPYDPNHLLMTGHAFDLLVQSTDGGETWSAVHIESGMNSNGGTGGINFIDTGNAETTRNTWLWMASDTVVGMGTWRTSNGGGGWTKVSDNDHPAGVSEIFQPDTSGIVFMPGIYSSQGHGVFRSADYGITWTKVGLAQPERVVFQTKKHIYAAAGGAAGPNAPTGPNLQLAELPGTGTWNSGATPSEMYQGPAQASVSVVGDQSVILLANYNAGMWRYVESN